MWSVGRFFCGVPSFNCFESLSSHSRFILTRDLKSKPIVARVFFFDILTRVGDGSVYAFAGTSVTTASLAQFHRNWIHSLRCNFCKCQCHEVPPKGFFLHLPSALLDFAW